MRIKRGDRLRYTGEYAPAVEEEAKYTPGTVVKVKASVGKVVVKLDSGHYADWPIEEVERA